MINGLRVAARSPGYSEGTPPSCAEIIEVEKISEKSQKDRKEELEKSRER